MEPWIPLLQSLVWPIFLVVVLFAFRRWLNELLEVIKKRVETGSAVSIGLNGFSLSTAPKLESEEPESVGTTKKPVPQDEYYLIHGATYNPRRSAEKGRPYYDIRVQLESDNPAALDRVSKVIYHLHPTFRNPVREITTRDNNFEMTTFGYGQFELRAEVHLKDTKQPILLSRYINF
jgi:flagellar basal body-associated protein FliL